jgi:putative addiction module killer protein
MGDVESLGQGLSEMRVDVGPGYRVYMTRQGKAVILLLCGGDKSTQRRDIKAARAMIGVLAAAKKAKKRPTKKK